MYYLHFCLSLRRFEGTQQNFGFVPQKKPEMKKGSIGSGYDADDPSWCTLILHFHSHDSGLTGSELSSKVPFQVSLQILVQGLSCV